MTALHGAFHFALAFAVLYGVAFVVLGLALGQCDVALDLARFPMQVDGHQGVALLLDLADQPFDLFFVQQQLARAGGFGVDVGGCGFQRVDQAANDEQLTVADDT